MYFDYATYWELYGILAEDDDLKDYAEDFASFFTEVTDSDGTYYVVSNLANYTAWLGELFGDDGIDEDWLKWSGILPGKSTESGGGI